MKKIGVIVNTKRPQAENVLKELAQKARERGFTLFTEDKATAELLGGKMLSAEEFASETDVVLAMGGDGTVLYSARVLHGADVPIMGINLGNLGFLTSMGDREIDRALNALVTGNYKISERTLAKCRIFNESSFIGEEHALNDVVLGWGTSSRIVTLQLSIDGESIGSFMCDGMIISTPTGSTGHSLSSGGPILHPKVNVFGISVICPHTLSSRPLVVPDSSLIEVEVVRAAKELILSIDGQDEYVVVKGYTIKIRKSSHRIKFLQPPEHSYFSVLSQKLHWRGSSL